MENAKIHVEIQLKEEHGRKGFKSPQKHVLQILNKIRKHIRSNVLYSGDSLFEFCLPDEILSLVVSGNIPRNLQEEDVIFYSYTSNDHGPEAEPLDDIGSGSEETTASNHWLLPSSDFVGLWESLIFEDGVKEQILKFVETAMIFSERKINTNLISCNRIVLLHGPPGMGKTSLCRAVAQKISIRFQKKYSHIHLVEINSHSLFSKWFSESGKLVQKLFNQLRDLVESSSSMVCILIDEIESIAFARSAISNNEPTDSIRAVNAFLTQLDQIRKYTNVLVLATSNLTSSIDVAFLDRADIKQFIGPPSDTAISTIYSTMIIELVRAGIISGAQYHNDIDLLEHLTAGMYKNEVFNELCVKSRGLSGRTMRKIPMLAHVHYVQQDKKGSQMGINLFEFIKAMIYAVVKHTSDTECVNKQ